ncbi:MAG: hypothetical protein IPL61_36660 [Myxococcales bacterium]|nr:hypothetical protein [Myxococcales bacterium]
MSTRRARALVFAVSVVPVVACVDARKRFDEYDERLPHIDASTIDAPIVDMIPDIDGDWLLAVDPSVAQGNLVQMRVTWNITSAGATGTLDGSYQPLKTFAIASPDERVPVGAPVVANGVAVDDTATFVAHLVGTLPGDANPVSGTEYPLDVNLTGTIRSMDSVCGTATGTVGPLDVGGSTWAAVRITGATLPTALGTCPAAMELDAGVDAAIELDAGVDAP